LNVNGCMRRGFINIYPDHTVPAHLQSLVSDYPTYRALRQPTTCHICRYGYQHEHPGSSDNEEEKRLPKKVLDSWLANDWRAGDRVQLHPARRAPGAMVSF